MRSRDKCTGGAEDLAGEAPLRTWPPFPVVKGAWKRHGVAFPAEGESRTVPGDKVGPRLPPREP